MINHFPGASPEHWCPRCHKNLRHVGSTVCLPCLEKCENRPGHEHCEPEWCHVSYIEENGK